MSTISTSLCRAKAIEIEPVRINCSSIDGHMFATQDVTVVLEDGQRFQMTIYMAEGCTGLAAGEPVVLPSVPVVEGA